MAGKEYVRELRDDAVLYCKDPSKTKQEFVDEVNLNNIMERFQASGQAGMASFRPPGVSGDLSSAVDFKTSLNIVMEAEAMFASLSGQVRYRFHNDPREFLEFMEDPKNLDEAVKLGIVSVTNPPGPQEVKVVSMPEVKKVKKDVVDE